MRWIMRILVLAAAVFFLKTTGFPADRPEAVKLDEGFYKMQVVKNPEDPEDKITSTVRLSYQDATLVITFTDRNEKDERPLTGQIDPEGKISITQSGEDETTVNLSGKITSSRNANGTLVVLRKGKQIRQATWELTSLEPSPEKPAKGVKLEPGKYRLQILKQDKEFTRFREASVELSYDGDKFVISPSEDEHEGQPSITGLIHEDGTLTAQQNFWNDKEIATLVGKVLSAQHADGTFQSVRDGVKETEGIWELTKVKE